MFQPEDYTRVIDALPEKVKDQLIAHTDQVVLAGGFIRDTLLKMPISDIDVFCKTEELAKTLSEQYNHGLGVIKTDCSYTCMVDNIKTQYVYCRIFSTAQSLINEFDFTCCGVALQWGNPYINQWCWSEVEGFKEDTENKILVFRCAEYNRGNLGALSRAFRFTAKGWYLPQKEMAKIVHHYIQPNFQRRTDNQRQVPISNYGQTRSEAGRDVEREIDRLYHTTPSGRRRFHQPVPMSTPGGIGGSWVHDSFLSSTVERVDRPVVSWDFGAVEERLLAYVGADVAATNSLRGNEVAWVATDELAGTTTQGSTTNEQEVGLAEVQNAVNPRYNPSNRSRESNG